MTQAARSEATYRLPAEPHPFDLRLPQPTGPVEGSYMLAFVFFIFGFGTKQKHLGPGHTRLCPNCHNTTQWARIRQYQQFTLFFIPIARWKRRQFEQCGVCGTVAAV